MKRALLWWCLVLVWCGIIFGMSADRRFTGENTGAVLEKAAERVVDAPKSPRTTTVVDRLNYGIRKAAHGVGFAVLGGLTFFAIRAWPAPSWSSAAAAWVFTTLYAVSDEFHQRFVPGRTGTTWDVLIDSAAAGFALFLLTRFRWAARERSRGNT